MTQLNQVDFERQVLHAFTWLRQYTPILEYGQEYVTHGSILYGILDVYQSGVPEIEEERIQALDTIHDSIQSSLFDAENPLACLTTPMELLPIPVDQTILLDFWTPLYQLHDYWTARIGKMKQSMHARLICCRLLERLAHTLGDRPEDQQRIGMGLLLPFLFEEYLGEPQRVHTTTFKMRRCICTCAPSAHSNEVEETRLLIDAYAATLPSGPSDDHAGTGPGPGPSDDCRTPLLAILDAKQVYLGAMAKSIGRGRRLLQIALPFQHVVCGHTTVFPSSFRRMRANLRLICLQSPRGLGVARIVKDNAQIDSENSDVNHFDLSEQLTSYILESYAVAPKVTLEDGNFINAAKETVFHGTTRQREECLRLIIQEIGQEAEDQTDKFRRILILARVVHDFSKFWKITASDDGSEAGDIIEEPGLIA